MVIQLRTVKYERLLRLTCAIAAVLIALEVAALTRSEAAPEAPRADRAPAFDAPVRPVAVVPTTTLPRLDATTTSLPRAIPASEASTPSTGPPVEAFRIRIARIGLDVPVYRGVDLDTLSNGPGHWLGSAAPGQPGNVVVAGHRVTWTRPFFDLDVLSPGDVVEVGAVRYRVDGVFVVSPEDVWIADPTPEPTLTLFACHPKFSAAQRIVVTARMIGAG